MKKVFEGPPMEQVVTNISDIIETHGYMYRLYNEDEGLSNIHDRGRSPRTCIFDDPESELYNRLVPECGGVSDSYWFIPSCPM